jgi:DNA polymerase III subunit delta'
VARTFDELLGQDLAARRLSSMIARERLAHALLFFGPKGVGKLAAAKLLAQVLMCTARKSGEAIACDACPGCAKVKELLHADLQIIATNEPRLKVDEIRGATRSLQLRSMEGLAKIVIIDAADKMTIEAQNALLKTLEEPPGAALIILVSAKPTLLLPTVLSRCQRVPFKPIPRESIARVLVETRDIASDKALVVASMAQGSLGVALEMDPEALGAARDAIAEIDRIAVPGRRNAGYEALELSSGLGEERAELGGKLDLLLVWLRDQALLASGAELGSITNLDRETDLVELAHERGLRMILERAEIVLHAKRQLDLPFNLNGQMIAEQMCLALSGLLPVPESA